MLEEANQGMHTVCENANFHIYFFGCRCTTPVCDVIFNMRKVTLQKMISWAGSENLWGGEEGIHWHAVSWCYRYFYFPKSDLRIASDSIDFDSVGWGGGGGWLQTPLTVFSVFSLEVMPMPETMTKWTLCSVVAFLAPKSQRVDLKCWWLTR